MSAERKGKVYLVGAGPGDPSLLTLKGKHCLERAEVIIYDTLANERLLSYAPPRSRRELASTVAFVTGHPAEEVSGIDWRALAGIATVVFLMGTKRLPEIVAALVKHGRHRRRRSRSSGPVAGPFRRPSRGACATSWRRLRGYAP